MDHFSGGIPDSGDDQFSELLIWNDVDQDGVSDNGELQGLASWGIASIDLATQSSNETLNGHQITQTGTVSFEDGRVHEAADVIFESDLSSSFAILPDDFEYAPEALHLPVLWGYGNITSTWVSLSVDADLRSMAMDLVGEISAGEVLSFQSNFEEFVLSWAGVDDVDPDGRGPHMDGRHLAFLERVYGFEFEQPAGGSNTTSDPNRIAAELVEDQYDVLVQRLAGRFVAQAAVADAHLFSSNFVEFFEVFGNNPLAVFSSLALEYSPENRSLSGDIAPVLEQLELSIADGSISTGNAAAAVLMLQSDFSQNSADFAQILNLAMSDAGMDAASELRMLLEHGIGHELIEGTAAGDTLSSDLKALFIGGDGDDNITGGDTGSIFFGGQGDDTLNGGDRSDTYLYRYGDGSDTIADFDYLTQDGTDAIKLLDLNPDDVSFSQTPDGSLTITFGDGEAITVTNHFDRNGDNAIEQISFADGTILDLQGIRDKSVADQKASGIVIGSELAENYEHALGDGSYEITDFDYLTQDGSDSLTFTDVNVADAVFSQGADDSLIITLPNGEAITIVSHFTRIEDNAIEIISFADGTVLNGQGIRDKSVADQQASGVVIGSELAENYQHAMGDGSYLITDHDYLSQDGTDTLTFTDVNATDITFAQGPDHSLVITLANGETVTVERQFKRIDDNAIEVISFADGTVLNGQDIRDRAVADMRSTGLVLGSEMADNFVHTMGDGSYTIDDYNLYGGFVDRLILTDQNLTDVTFSQTQTDDLVATLSNSEEITILGHFATAARDMETIEFADGTLLDTRGITISDFALATGNTADPDAVGDTATVDEGDSVLIDVLANDTDADRGTIAVVNVTGSVNGTAAIETGQVRYTPNAGFSGTDTLSYEIEDGQGGTATGSVTITVEAASVTGGDDLFVGTGGNDQFFFSPNMGNDQIETRTANYQEVDQLIFAAGISVEDLYATFGSGTTADLTIGLHDGGGTMTILDYGSNSSTADRYHINEFVFEDGTVLDRNAFMLATMGTSGDDTFDGTGESDDYAFNADQGNDTIVETTANYLENDRIVFGTGITADDLVTTFGSGTSADLTISLTNASGSMTLAGYGNNASTADRYHIDQFVFEDGTVLDRNAFMLATMGTSSDDTFDGTGESDDYAFGAGQGHDTITETSANYLETDRLVFEVGVTATDVFSFRDDVDSDGTDDLVIGLYGAEGSISVLDAFSTSSQVHRYQLDEFVFGDGTTLNYDDFVIATLDQSQETGFFV